jgi:adenine phosphoribosyltransferase
MTANFYPHITEAFETTVVQKIGDYPYPISPFAGVTTPIKSELLTEVAQAALKEKSFASADLIVTFESSGTQLAAVVGQALKLSYLVARKKRFALPHEISFAVTTNFDAKDFYVYGDVTNKKIIIIDDVVASGTTLKNATLALRNAGAEVLALFAVAAKTNIIGKKYEDILRDINVPLISLIQIKVVNEKVIVF